MLVIFVLSCHWTNRIWTCMELSKKICGEIMCRARVADDSKDSTTIRNQIPSSNYRNVYFAFLLMRQRQNPCNARVSCTF